MDNLSFKLLNLYSQRETLSLSDLAAIYNISPVAFSKPIEYLIDNGFLIIVLDHNNLHDPNHYAIDTPIQITYKGRAALEAERKERHKMKFSEIRAWLTLIIALAAFVKSFFL